MSLSARAVALQGFGFGARFVALQGLVPFGGAVVVPPLHPPAGHHRRRHAVEVGGRLKLFESDEALAAWEAELAAAAATALAAREAVKDAHRQARKARKVARAGGDAAGLPLVPGALESLPRAPVEAFAPMGPHLAPAAALRDLAEADDEEALMLLMGAAFPAPAGDDDDEEALLMLLN